MPQYEVIVGNIGTVYSGPSKAEADTHYTEYVSQSETNYGRAGGEDVTMMEDGEPIQEHVGTLSLEADEDTCE